MADNGNVAPIRYGRRKMDEKAYEAQAKKKKATSGGKVYGARKGGGTPAAQDMTEQGGGDVNPFLSSADANGNGRVTLAEVEAKLTANPELLDEAITAEFADGKPRKGAVELFYDLETAKAEPREDIVQMLESFATAE